MKSRLIAVVAGLAFLISGCGSMSGFGGSGKEYKANHDSPENVVFMMVKGGASKDAKMVCDAFDTETLELFKSSGQSCVDLMKKDVDQMAKKLAEEDITKDNVSDSYDPKVSYSKDKKTAKVKPEPEAKDSETIPVKQVDGKWYVDIMGTVKK